MALNLGAAPLRQPAGSLFDVTDQTAPWLRRTPVYGPNGPGRGGWPGGTVWTSLPSAWGQLGARNTKPRTGRGSTRASGRTVRRSGVFPSARWAMGSSSRQDLFVNLPNDVFEVLALGIRGCDKLKSCQCTQSGNSGLHIGRLLGSFEDHERPFYQFTRFPIFRVRNGFFGLIHSSSPVSSREDASSPLPRFREGFELKTSEFPKTGSFANRSRIRFESRSNQPGF